MEDIAIIGMSCRFPGAASSINGFWQMLAEGQSAWSEFPADRLNIDGFYHPDGHRQGSIHFKGAHFVRNDLAAFDATFFSMTEEEAKALDPQQRMLLETSYEAIENAGLRIEDLKGSDTSVYVGAFVRDYEQVSLRDMDFQPRYAATGTGTAIMSNRLSYFYDLRGPSMTVDTGCSGSMVALHQACQSIISGNSSLAFAGGAGLILTPNTMIPMTALNFLSPDGKSYTFDSRANGYGRGEGAGIVILKKLRDALRDNDPIRAVIRSSHLSQDGRTAGITLPNPEAQIFNIHKTYEQANLDFKQTGYVECHGTGTQAGDTSELSAIARTLSLDRPSDEPLLVGSVKPNIGHLEGASGIAGVIKAALVLEKATIPPNINFERGNPDINFEEWKLHVPTRPLPWPMPGIRRASVNCFGFGGTNAHVVLDEGEHYIRKYRERSADPAQDASSTETGCSPKSLSPCQLFLLTGPNKLSAQRIKQALADHLTGLPKLPQKSFDEMAYTLNCRRSSFKWKGFVTATDSPELIGALSALRPDDFVCSVPRPNFKIALVFCGQGAQRAEMGKGLMTFPVFKRSLQLASEHLKNELLSPYDLLEEMMKPVGHSRIDEPSISQPATTALQVALVDLVVSFGVQPTAVVGHSSGEIAAAYACSMISRKTAWALAYHRGVCAKLLMANSKPRGSMCFVAMSEASAIDFLCKYPRKVNVAVACINSPKSVTLSGDAKDVNAIVRDLQLRNVFCRAVATGVAYHSRHMENVEKAYLNAINSVPDSAQPQTCEMYSTLTGRRMREGEYELKYWADNLKSQVRFSDAMTAMLNQARPDMILELSPHSALKAPTLEIVNASSAFDAVSYMSALIRKDDEQMTLLTTLGEMWQRGCKIDMSQVVTRNNSVLDLNTATNLPLYPWDHTNSFWHESAIMKDYRMRKHGRKDLIGAPCADASSQEPRWRGFLRISENPWLRDHQVQHAILYPAAGIISTVIEGARQHIPYDSHACGFEVQNMEILKPMVIPDTELGLETMVNMKRLSLNDSTNTVSFEWSIYGRVSDGSWTHHARGKVHAISTAGLAAIAPGIDKAAAKLAAVHGRSINTQQFYDSLDLLGMNYGPAFRNITTISHHDATSLATIKVADTKAMMPLGYECDHIVHPTTLDSAFQLLFALQNQPMVPTSIDSVYISTEVSRVAGQKLLGCAKATKHGLRGAMASMVLTDNAWCDPAVVVKGLHLTAISAPDFLPNYRNLCTEMQWKEDYTTSITNSFKKLLGLMTHKYPRLSVLQVGGNCALACHTLQLLHDLEGSTPRVERYSLTDTHPDVFNAEKHRLRKMPLCHVLELRNLQASTEVPNYHLILKIDTSADVVGLEKCLHPDGIILRREEGQLVTDYESDSACSVDEAAHRVVIGYSDEGREVSVPFTMTPVSEKLRHDCRQQNVVIMLPDTAPPDVLKLKDNISASLTAIFVKVSHCSFGDVAQGHLSIRNCIVISLLDLANTPFFWDCQEEDFKVFKRVRDAAKSILWVTQGASGTTHNPQTSLVTGLARTLASEEPEKIFVTVCLGCNTMLSAGATSRVVVKALRRSMLLEVHRLPRELEYIECGNRLLIPRLMTCQRLNDLIEDDPRRFPKKKQSFLSSEKVALTLLPPHEGDKTFANAFFMPQKDSALPGANEVEISVTAAALHQNDADTFMGLSEQDKVGVDIQGTVTAIGSGVAQLRLNDPVVAISSEAMSNRVRVDKRFVKRITGGLLTCIPSIWVTVFYALAVRCRVGSRTRVLVHRGATAMGQVAIQVAKILGAQVYTTVCNDAAGDDLQRDILVNTFRFADEEVEDCSKPGWDAKLLQATKGHMMDIVLVPGRIPFHGNVVKKTGTVVHMNDTSRGHNIGVESPLDHSTIRIDFANLLAEDPDLVAEVFGEVARFFREFSGRIFMTQHPNPFSITHLPIALRTVRDKPNLGATLVFADHTSLVEVASKPDVKELSSCIDGGTYVLAGGLGGLGRAIAQHLVDHGAKNLLFLSRSSEIMGEAKEFLSNLDDRGVAAWHCAVDICDAEALRKAMSSLIPKMPPVSGVIQGAAVLRDKIFERMTYDEWRTAVLPKTHGTMNLVNFFDNPTQKPWFIFLSSSSGIIGNRGQANYAAGNTFMDVLAGSGLIHGRAVSLDIGPVLEVGMVAEDSGIMKRLRETGFLGIRRVDFLKIIERAIGGDIGLGEEMPTQVILGVGTGGLLLQNRPKDPFWAHTALFSNLGCVDMPPHDLSVFGGPNAFKVDDTTLPRDDVNMVAQIIKDDLRCELGFRVATIKAQDIDPERSVASYGFDSILAVQIRNWAFKKFGLNLSIFAILAERPMRDLCQSMAEQVCAADDQEDESVLGQEVAEEADKDDLRN